MCSHRHYIASGILLSELFCYVILRSNTVTIITNLLLANPYIIGGIFVNWLVNLNKISNTVKWSKLFQRMADLKEYCPDCLEEQSEHNILKTRRLSREKYIFLCDKVSWRQFSFIVVSNKQSMAQWHARYEVGSVSL